MDESLDLTLRAPSDEPLCDEQIYSNRDAKTAAATVFIKRADAAQSLKLYFTTEMRKATTEAGITQEGITKPASVDVYFYDGGCSKSAAFPVDKNIQAFNIVFVAGFTPAQVPVLSTLLEFVQWFWSFTPPDSWRAVNGQLIVKSEDHPQTVPGTLSVQLISRPGGYGQYSFIVILVIGAIWGVYKGFKAYRRLGELAATEVHPAKRKQWLRDKLAFEFKSGWASTLTTTGAILGTLLSASVLPSETVLLSKEQYISLNVLFGLVLVFAAVWHNLRQSGRSFLIAYALTLGAGMGELITALLVLQEIGFQGSIPELIVRLTQILLLYAAYRATRAATGSAIEKIKKPRAKGGLV